MIKTYITVIIIICGISLCKNLIYVITRKVYLQIKVNITYSRGAQFGDG